MPRIKQKPGKPSKKQIKIPPALREFWKSLAIVGNPYATGFEMPTTPVLISLASAMAEKPGVLAPTHMEKAENLASFLV
ncbi:hypothetical protein ADUPG1_003464, partial [Aduncisulcus paluster]